MKETKLVVATSPSHVKLRVLGLCAYHQDTTDVVWTRWLLFVYFLQKKKKKNIGKVKIKREPEHFIYHQEAELMCSVYYETN